MLLAQHAPAHGEHLLLQRPRPSQITLTLERQGQVVHQGQGVGVLLAQVFPVNCQGALETMARGGVERGAVLQVASAAVQQAGQLVPIDGHMRTETVELQNVRHQAGIPGPMQGKVDVRR